MRNLQSEVEGVKNIMTQNVERILARGENLDHLRNKTEDLEATVRWGACWGGRFITVWGIESPHLVQRHSRLVWSPGSESSNWPWDGSPSAEAFFDTAQSFL